jgi:hypothetical protein
VNLDYHFDKDISLGVLGQYFHTWFEDQNRPQSANNPGLNQSYASYLGDTGIFLADKNITDFGGPKVGHGFVLGGSQGYLAPTSEGAQAAGSAGETRTNLNLSKSFGKLDLKWTEELRYYFQQYETNAFLNASGQPIVNSQYRVLSLLDIGYNFTSKLSLNLETGIVNEAEYGDSANGVPQTYIDYLVMNPEIDYAFNKTFTLALGIWEVYNYTNPPQLSTPNGNVTASYTPFAPYNGEAAGSWTGTEVFLQGTVKF